MDGYSSKTIDFSSKNKFQRDSKNPKVNNQGSYLKVAKKKCPRLTSLGNIAFQNNTNTVKGSFSTDASVEADEHRGYHSFAAGGINLKVSEKLRLFDFSAKKKMSMRSINKFSGNKGGGGQRKHRGSLNFSEFKKMSQSGSGEKTRFATKIHNSGSPPHQNQADKSSDGVISQEDGMEIESAGDDVHFSIESMSDGTRNNDGKMSEWLDDDIQNTKTDKEKDRYKKIHDNLYLLASFCGKSQYQSKPSRQTFQSRKSFRTRTVMSRVENRQSPWKQGHGRRETVQSPQLDKSSGSSSMIEYESDSEGSPMLRASITQKERKKSKFGLDTASVAYNNKGRSRFAPKKASIIEAKFETKAVRLLKHQMKYRNSVDWVNINMDRAKLMKEKAQPKRAKTSKPLPRRRTNIYKYWKPLVTIQTINQKRCLLLDIEKEQLGSKPFRMSKLK